MGTHNLERNLERTFEHTLGRTLNHILNRKEDIVIYGIGEAGKNLYRWLKLWGAECKIAFAVTKITDTAMCYGIPVIEISEINKRCPGAAVIIASVTDTYIREMTNTLKELEIDRYYCLTKEELGDLEKDLPVTVSDMRRLDKRMETIHSNVDQMMKHMARLKPRALLKFEVHIAEHCNLDCRGCFHCSPLARPELLTVEEYRRDCARLSKLYKGEMETIELLGGEPLLHPDITEFFKITRASFRSGQIMLVTNGLLLPKMNEAFWLAAKEYRVDIVPTRYPIPVDYDAIGEKASQYGIPYGYFEMTADASGNKVLENYHFDIEGRQDAQKNFLNCYRGNYCITLSHGRLYTCAICAHLHHLKDYFKLDTIFVSERNSIDIYEARSGEEISEFLTRPIPACRYCRFEETKTYIPFQRTQKRLEEWL